MLPTVPETYSIVRARATPIWYPEELPLVAVKSVNNCISLYGVVSPVMFPISGVPYTFVIFKKLPISNVVIPAFIFLTSLDFFRSNLVLAVFSI